EHDSEAYFIAFPPFENTKNSQGDKNQYPEPNLYKGKIDKRNFTEPVVKGELSGPQHHFQVEEERIKSGGNTMGDRAVKQQWILKIFAVSQAAMWQHHAYEQHGNENGVQHSGRGSDNFFCGSFGIIEYYRIDSGQSDR